MFLGHHQSNEIYHSGLIEENSVEFALGLSAIPHDYFQPTFL